MKKTLVALAVLAAGSAQAGIELYSQDGVTVNLGGDIEVRYVQGTEDNSELTQQIDDSDLSFDIRYAVNDDVQLGGFWEFQDRGVNEGDAYVAAYAGAHTLKIGKLCTAVDDAGIGDDFVFGIKSFFENSDVACGNQVIRYDLDTGDVYATAAVRAFSDNNDASDDDSYIDGRIGYRGIEDFDFTAIVGALSKTANDETLWTLQARYTGIDKLGLAAAYYSMDNETVVTNTIGLTANYKLDMTTLAAGVSKSDSDASGSEDFTTWYVNAGYPVAPSTTAYVEVGGNDKDDHGTGYAVGIKASF